MLSFRIGVFIFSKFMPWSGIAGLCGNSILSFLNNPHTVFETVVVPVYVPTSSVGGFPFSIPSPAFVICRHLEDGHSDQHEVMASL